MQLLTSIGHAGLFRCQQAARDFIIEICYSILLLVQYFPLVGYDSSLILKGSYFLMFHACTRFCRMHTKLALYRWHFAHWITVGILTVVFCAAPYTLTRAAGRNNVNAQQTTSSVAQLEYVNARLRLRNMVENYLPDSRPFAPAGVFVIDATLVNVEPESIHSPVVEVAELSDGFYLLNADDGPMGRGARMTVPVTVLGADELLTSGEAITVRMEVGMPQRTTFDFVINVLGVVNYAPGTAPTQTAPTGATPPPIATEAPTATSTPTTTMPVTTPAATVTTTPTSTTTGNHPGGATATPAPNVTPSSTTLPESTPINPAPTNTPIGTQPGSSTGTPTPSATPSATGTPEGSEPGGAIATPTLLPQTPRPSTRQFYAIFLPAVSR